jgi:hypothetical protein
MTNNITKIFSFAVATLMVVSTGFSILTNASSPLVTNVGVISDEGLKRFCKSIGMLTIRGKKCKELNGQTGDAICNQLYPMPNTSSKIRKRIAEKALISCNSRIGVFLTNTSMPRVEISKAEQDKIDASRKEDEQKKAPSADDLKGTIPATNATSPILTQSKSIFGPESITSFDDMCKIITKEAQVNTCQKRASNLNKKTKSFKPLRKEFCNQYTRGVVKFEKTIREPIYQKCVSIEQSIK